MQMQTIQLKNETLSIIYLFHVKKLINNSRECKLYIVTPLQKNKKTIHVNINFKKIRCKMQYNYLILKSYEIIHVNGDYKKNMR